MGSGVGVLSTREWCSGQARGQSGRAGKQPWSPGRRGSHHKIFFTRRLHVIPYRAMLDVPDGLVRYLARLLAAERRYRGTPARSRKLTPRGQAVLALRWFRDRTRIEALGRDHGISRATAYRYVAEAVGVLSAQAPDLAGALERALAEG